MTTSTFTTPATTTMNTSRPTTSTTATDEYPYSVPDFGGNAAHPNKINVGRSGDPHANSNGAHLRNRNDDLLCSMLDGYKAPSTPSELPPHIPTPPELANRQLGHKQSSDNSSNSNKTSSSKSKSQSSIPPPSDISAYQKKGQINMGYIEKVGSTAMQSEQEKSKSNSRLGFGGLNKSRTTDSSNTNAAAPSNSNASRTSTNDQGNSNAAGSMQQTTNPNATSTNQSSQRGSSGKPQKGEAGYEEAHEEEQGAARGEGVPSSAMSKPSQDNNDQGAPETQSGDNENQDQEGNDGQEGQKGPNDDMCPVQRHAGKVNGVGPEYGSANRVTVSDRLQGVKEQIKGTILRKPDIKQRGKERMTGELKKKEKEEENNADPFKSAPDDKSEEKGNEAKGGSEDNKETEGGSDAPSSENADESLSKEQQQQDTSRRYTGDESSNTLWT